MGQWLRFINAEGSFATVFVIYTGGAFLTGLALLLGANDFEISILAAIPFLAQTAQIVAAYLVDKSGKRKNMTIWSLFAGRQLWWLVIPVLFLHVDWKLEALIVAVVLSNLLVMLATPGWLSWMADLVPGNMRGQYFATRNVYVSISTIAATVLGGFFIDQFRHEGRELEGFTILIGLAAVFALIAVLILNRLPDRPAKEIRTTISRSHLLEPLRNREFSRLLKVFLVWNVAIGISAPFFVPHMLNVLKMSFTQISLYSGASALVAILLNKPWGKVIDRFGCKPVVAFCAFGIAVIPMLWLIPRQGHLNILIFESIYSGFLWAGFNLAAFNIPIANSPQKGRTTYLAMFSVITGLAFFAASLIGGLLAQNWRDFSWIVGNQVVINYHLVFALSGILRLLSAFLVLSFKEPEEKGIPIMIQFIGYSILRRLSIGRQIFPWFLKSISGGN